MILAPGLRRDELKQLCWGDVKLNAPLPCIHLRAETTKAKRADVLPVRAAAIRQGDGDREPKLTISNGNDLRMKMPHRQDGAKQAGEGGRTLDIHVGNVTLYH